MGNRQAATEWLVNLVGKMVPDSPNAARTKKELDSLTDEEFEALMVDYENGKDWPSVIVPIGASYDVDTQRNLAIGEEIGVKFFERIWSTDQSTGLEVLSNMPALIMDEPARRQKQHLVDKSSIAKNNRHVDELTGQPTGDSKGSAITNPQALILRSRGLDVALIEFMKVRGGDQKAFNYSNRAIWERGDVTLSEIERLGSRPKSVETLRAFWTGQHLENNL